MITGGVEDTVVDAAVGGITVVDVAVADVVVEAGVGGVDDATMTVSLEGAATGEDGVGRASTAPITRITAKPTRA